MALAKDIQTPIGSTAGYWKIVALDCVFHTPALEQVTRCTLQGWENESKRNEHRNIDERKFTWTGETAPTNREQAYTAIKQTDEFAGASDV